MKKTLHIDEQLLVDAAQAPQRKPFGRDVAGLRWANPGRSGVWSSAVGYP